MSPEPMAAIAGNPAFAQTPIKTYPVPEAAREVLKPLALEANEWEIRTHCAMTRKMNAIHRDGDAEKAIVEDRTYQDCATACADTKTKVGEAVRLAVPEIPAGGKINLQIPEWVAYHEAGQA